MYNSFDIMLPLGFYRNDISIPALSKIFALKKILIMLRSQYMLQSPSNDLPELLAFLRKLVEFWTRRISNMTIFIDTGIYGLLHPHHFVEISGASANGGKDRGMFLQQMPGGLTQA